MIKEDPFKEYIKETEPSKKELGYSWYTAIGLQAVDGIKTSAYLNEVAKKNIEGDITIDEAIELIQSYYNERPDDKDERIEEADKVSAQISKILSEKAFTFSPAQYLNIHKRLFDGIYNFAGKMRTYNISKKEWVLNGDTVMYGGFSMLKETLNYDFELEKSFSYKGLSKDELISHLARFVSNLWQIHVFGEGNTRTTAVFFILYLRTLGFSVTNDIFAENAWYFRNALVRANYTNYEKNITETTEYLELFLRNLLFGEKNELKNRYLHIDWNSKPNIEDSKPNIEDSKPNIEYSKPNIEYSKPNIENLKFVPKTMKNIEKLQEKVKDNFFGRTDVKSILGLSNTAAYELIKKLLDKDIIIPVGGHGKGKYRFR